MAIERWSEDTGGHLLRMGLKQKELSALRLRCHLDTRKTKQKWLPSAAPDTPRDGSLPAGCKRAREPGYLGASGQEISKLLS